MFTAFASFILAAKLELFNERYSTGDIFTMEPRASVRGMRMLLYREEAEYWRDTHKTAVDLLRRWNKENDLESIFNYTRESIEFMLEIIGLL